MWAILLSLSAGALIGYFINLSDKNKKINGKIQLVGVIFLLFSMGAAAGGNKAVISNLKNIGKISLTFAVLTSLLSIIAVFVVTNKFMKGRKVDD